MMHNLNTRLIPLFSTLALSLILMSSHLYVPALPAITDYYATSKDLTQMTLPLNLLGSCLSGLIYGPISDVYGRRPILLWGMIFFYFLQSYVSLPLTSMFLILFRFLQGCGGGACMALSLVMIKDLFDGEKCTQIFSRISVTLTITPAIAPIIGGYLTVFLGWKATFVFIACGGSIIFVLFLYKLPETFRLIPPEIPLKTSELLSIKSIFQPYLRLFRNKEFNAYAILHSILFAGQWCFVAAAPFVFIQHLHIATTSFGYYMSSITLLYILSSLLIQHIALKVGNQRLIKWGVNIGIISSVLFLIIAVMFPRNVILLCIIMSFYVAAAAFVSPASATKALEINKQIKGASASLLSSIRIAAGFLGTFIAGVFRRY